jgi:hypothetical protein
MAKNEDKKTNFPRIPASQWWQLREKFKNSIPPTVTPSYLSTALSGMNADSARKNILPPLKRLGIINDENKPTERAKQWRDNEMYPKYCEDIRKEVYPDELLHAQPPPSPDKDAVKRWFASTTGLGEDAARQMAAVYLLLCEAKPLDKEELKNKKTPSERNRSQRPKSNEQTPQAQVQTPPDNTNNAPLQNQSSRFMPSIHIDIQIHISPESSAAQIDQIFESMAKHLGKMSDGKDEQSS